MPRCIFIFAGSMFASFGEMLALDYASQGESIETLGRIVWPTNAKPTDDEWKNVSRVGRFTGKEWLDAKGSDFKSRLTGVLDISGITNPLSTPVWFTREGSTSERASDIGVDFSVGQAESEASRIRRAIALRSILQLNAKHLLDNTDELAISNSVLQSLLDSNDGLLHGFRSLKSLIQMSSMKDRAAFDRSVLPTESQQRIHASDRLFSQR